jgi:hypothetical protein
MGPEQRLEHQPLILLPLDPVAEGGQSLSTSVGSEQQPHNGGVNKPELPPPIGETSLHLAGVISPSPVTGLPDINRFPNTMGYPTIYGGIEEGKDDEDWNWELFEDDMEKWVRTIYLPRAGGGMTEKLEDTDWTLLERSPEEFYRKKFPHFNDEVIAWLAEQIRLVQLVEKYEKLSRDFNIPKKQLDILEDEIIKRRYNQGSL